MGYTANQWAILALVLVLGWLLGLLSRSGGARWRREAEAERTARADAERRLAEAQLRNAELERLATPVVPGTGRAIGAAAAGRRDDLSLIRGVGRERETQLNELGVHGYRDLASLSDADAGALEPRLGVAPGTIAREQWREQAAALRDGDTDGHGRRWPWQGRPL